MYVANRKTKLLERVKEQMEKETLKKQYGNQPAIGDIEKMDVDQRQRLVKEAQKKEKDKKDEKVGAFSFEFFLWHRQTFK